MWDEAVSSGTSRRAGRSRIPWPTIATPPRLGVNQGQAGIRRKRSDESRGGDRREVSKSQSRFAAASPG